MAVCYNKLWKILIDRGMSKTELIKAAKIIAVLKKAVTYLQRVYNRHGR